MNPNSSFETKPELQRLERLEGKEHVTDRPQETARGPSLCTHFLVGKRLFHGLNGQRNPHEQHEQGREEELSADLVGRGLW